MNTEFCYEIIENIASENEFILEGNENSFFLYQDREHTEAFSVKKKDNSYLVYQWEKESQKYSTHSIYALRNVSEIIKFCNIVIFSSDIRAGRDKG